jgi:hypothetical protein
VRAVASISNDDDDIIIIRSVRLNQKIGLSAEVPEQQMNER